MNDTNDMKSSQKDKIETKRLSQDVCEDQVITHKSNSKKPEALNEYKEVKIDKISSVSPPSDRCLSLFEHSKCTDKKFYCYR